MSISRTFTVVEAILTSSHLEPRAASNTSSLNQEPSCTPSQGYYCCPGTSYSCPIGFTCTIPSCSRPATPNDWRTIVILITCLASLTLLFTICIFATTKVPSTHHHTRTFIVKDLEVTGTVRPGGTYLPPPIAINKNRRPVKAKSTASSVPSQSPRSSYCSDMSAYRTPSRSSSFSSITSSKRFSGSTRPINPSPLATEWKDLPLVPETSVNPPSPVHMDRTGYRKSSLGLTHQTDPTKFMPPFIEPQYLCPIASSTTQDGVPSDTAFLVASNTVDPDAVWSAPAMLSNLQTRLEQDDMRSAQSKTFTDSLSSATTFSDGEDNPPPVPIKDFIE